MTQKLALPPLYYQIVDLIQDAGAFLVGGAVRDMLLGRPIHDLDFALPEDAVRPARKVADRLGGDFYLLDPERGSARVLLRDQNGQRLLADFTRFQGDSIEQDLRARDFTITSLGLDPRSDQQIIDLFQGRSDLQAGLIRTTTPEAIQNDPLRCLRAVRLAAQLTFRILPDTREQIRREGDRLREVSPERVRDELFRILAGPNQAAALGTLQQLALYSQVLPGSFSPRQADAARYLERFWALLGTPHDQDSAASWAQGLFVHRLGRFRDPLKQHLEGELVPGRTVRQLGFLTPLLHPFWDQDPGPEGSPEIPLSNQEADRLQLASQGARFFIGRSASADSLTPLEIYRFFRSFGPAGVEAVFLGLADLFEIKSSSAREKDWPGALELARSLLQGWWEKHSLWVDPPILLNGHDLQSEFSLEPGPWIGETLEALREAQVSRGLDSRQDALRFVRELIGASGRRGSD